MKLHHILTAGTLHITESCPTKKMNIGIVYLIPDFYLMRSQICVTINIITFKHKSDSDIAFLIQLTMCINSNT